MKEEHRIDTFYNKEINESDPHQKKKKKKINK